MSVIELKAYVEKMRANDKSLSEQKVDEKHQDKWRKLAYECVITHDKIHRWMVTSWSKTNSSKNATELTCKACFHQITEPELRAFRYRLEV